MRHIILTITIAILSIAGLCCADGLYQQQISNGIDVVSYYRAARIELNNSYGQAPAAEFVTEKITIMPNSEFYTKFVRRVTLSMGDPKREYPLYNPQSGAVIGTFTPEQYYVIQYSAWRAAESIADTPPPTPVGTQSRMIQRCDICHVAKLWG